MVDIRDQETVPSNALTASSDQTDEAEAPRLPDLADAVLFLARWHGLGPKREDLLRGLPLSEGGPTLDYLDDLAARAGLELNLVEEAPHRISPVTPPVILMRANGTPAIVTSIDQDAGLIKLADPLYGVDEPDVLSIGHLRSDFRRMVIYAVPRPSLDGDALLVAATSSAQSRSTYGGHWFWSAVRRFSPNYVQVVVAALLINLLGLASPIFIMNVYDRVIPNLAIPTLWALTAGVGLAILFDIILKLLRARIVDDTGRRVDMAIAGRLFDQIVSVRLASRPASGGAFASRMRDFDAVRDVLTSSTVVAITDLAFIGIFLWVMWLIVGPLVLVPTLAVPTVLVLTLLVQIPLAASLKQAQSDSAARQGILVETMSGIETLKASGAEGWMRRLWDQAVAASSRANTSARFWANAATTIVAATSQFVSVIIIVWGVFLVIEGDITVGALIAANILSGRVLAPLSNVAQTLSRLAQARGALVMLDQVMAAETEGGDPGSRDAPIEEFKGGLAFRNVSFSYPQAHAPAMDDVTFRIEPGERIGVLGRVGSGKSTLGRLVSGLYSADVGLVAIDGVDVRQHGIARLREAIGFCPQEPDIFSGTVRSNIVMGRPFASEAILERAVRMSGVAEFVSDHPHGLAMPVAEGGRSLSGGQRQAVAIARMMLREPKVIFLDEPSAALDVRTELQLVANLKAIADTGVTLIIATHRDRLLEAVDRLLVFEKGKLVSDGKKVDVIDALKSRAVVSPGERTGHAAN